MVFDPEKSPSLPNNELLEETVVKSESDLAPVPAPFESKIDINKAKNLGLSEKRIQELIDYEQSLVDKAPETKPEVTTEPVPAPFESKIDINKAKNLGLSEKRIQELIDYEQSLVDKAPAVSTSPRTVEDTTFFERIKESGTRGIESFEDIGAGYNLAYESLTGDDEEANRLMVAMKAERELARVPTLTARDIQKTFNESGLWPAGAKVPSFMIEKILESGPQMIVPMLVTGATTVATAPVLGPAAPLAGIASGIVTYGLQQFGNFMNTQGLAKDDAKDLRVGKAGLNAAISAPLGYVVDRFTLGLTKLGSGKKAKDIILKELQSRKKFGKTKAGAAGATLGFIAEAPTETLEAWLEREQAGLSLIDDEAKEAYFESFWSAGAVGAGIRGSVGTYQAYKEDEATKLAIDAFEELKDQARAPVTGDPNPPGSAEQQRQDAETIIDLRLAAEIEAKKAKEAEETKKAKEKEDMQDATTPPTLNKRTLEKLGLKESNSAYKRLLASFERGDDLSDPQVLAGVNKALEEAKALKNTDNELIDTLIGRIKFYNAPEQTGFPGMYTEQRLLAGPNLEDTVTEEKSTRKKARSKIPAAPGIASINQDMLSDLTLDPTTPLSEIENVYEYLRILPSLDLKNPVDKATARTILTEAKKDKQINDGAVDQLITRIDTPQLRPDAERGTQGALFAEGVVTEEAPIAEEAVVEEAPAIVEEAVVEEAPAISVLDETTLKEVGLKNKHPVYKRLLNLFKKGKNLSSPELRETVDKELIKAKRPKDTNNTAIDELRNRIKNDYRGPEQLEFSRMYDPVLDRMLPRPLQDKVDKKVDKKAAPGDTLDLFTPPEKTAFSAVEESIQIAELPVSRAKEQGFDVDTIYYHSTPNRFSAFNDVDADIQSITPDFSRFGFHFGSVETANNRAEDLLTIAEGKPIGESTNLEVFLKFKNPLYLDETRTGRWGPDDIFRSIMNTAEVGLMMASNKSSGNYKGITQADINAYYDDAFELNGKVYTNLDNIQEQRKFIAKLLEGMGHDAIQYSNQFEGGGLSTLIWNPENILFVDSVTDTNRPSNNREIQRSRQKRIDILRAVPNIETIPISSSTQDVAELKAKGRLGEYDVGLKRIKVTDLNDIDTLIHELFHAATAFGIRENINVKTGRAKTPLGKEILKLQKYITKYLTNPANEIDISSNPELLDIATNIDELINAAINDPKVQKLLGEIPTPTPKNRRPTLPTMWDELVDIIRRVINSLKNKFKGKAKNKDLDISDSVLNDILAVTPELMIGPQEQIVNEYMGEVLANTKKPLVEANEDAIFNEIQREKENSVVITKVDKALTELVDSSLSNTRALEREMGKRVLDELDSLDKKAADQELYAINTAQVLLADNVANRFLEGGVVFYDEGLKAFTAPSPSDLPSNTPSIAKRNVAISTMAEENGISQRRAELIAHQAFEALRHLEIFKHNKQVDETAMNYKRAGQNKKAREYIQNKRFTEHLSQEIVDERINNISKYKNLQNVLDIWQGVRKNTIDILVFGEVLDQNQANEWLDAAYWVPFLRAGKSEYNPLEVSGTLNLRTSIYKERFRGSTNEVQNILNNQELWVKLAVRNAIINKKRINIIDANLKYFSDVITRVSDSKKGETITVTRIDKDIPEFQEGDVIANKVVPVHYAINDADLQQSLIAAITGAESMPVSAPKSAKTLDAFGTSAANLLRLGVTLFPLFPLLQLFLRDTTTVAATADVKSAFKLYSETFKELMLNLSPKGSETHELLKQFGLTGSSESILQGIRETKNLDDPGVKNSILRMLGGGTPFAKEIRRGLEKFAMLSENALRQSVYNVVYEETGDKQRAIWTAIRYMEYRRSGSNILLQQSFSYIPFLRTTIQSMKVIGDAVAGRTLAPSLAPTAPDANFTSFLRGERGRRGLTGRLLKLMLKMQAFTIAYTLLMEDDEDYKKMTAQQRANVIIIPGTGLHIPLRQDPITIAWKTGPEMLVNRINGLQDSRESNQAITRSLREGFYFLGLPSAVGSIYQYSTNLTSTPGREGYPIISKSIENLKPEDQYNTGTTEFSKQLVKRLRNNEGSFIRAPEFIVPSPVVIDHFLRGMTGYAGQFGTWIFDAAAAGSGLLKVEPPAEDVSSFFRSFPGMTGVVNPQYNLNLESKFYALNRDAEPYLKQIMALSKKGDSDGMIALLESKGGLYQRMQDVKGDINRIKTELGKIRADEKRILDKPTILESNKDGLKPYGRVEKREELDNLYIKKINLLNDVEKIRDYVYDSKDMARSKRKNYDPELDTYNYKKDKSYKFEE